MKRQAKLIAVLTAAAILTAGASMTSLAGSGWLEENGAWIYVGDNGEKVTEKWVKSGEGWYWLDGSGQMAVDKFLEIDRNYYYFGEDGARVDSKWVAFANEDAGQEDEPNQHWYYFQKDGKAQKRSDNVSSGAVCAKEIEGKKYVFDTEGRMLYGWISDGERQTSEDAWQTSDYYFGGEDDGAMRVGWEQISIVDDNDEKVQPGENFWEEEQDRRFYFAESGKKVKGKSDDCVQKTIEGNKYGFDEYGRMIASWYADPTIITTEYAKGSEAYNSAIGQGGKNYSKQFMYFGSPESGAQYSDGWFKAVPSRYLMESKYKDGETYMYYADGSGYLYANELRNIDGEKYAFDNYGRQITGFACMIMSNGNTTRDIDKKLSSDDATNPFSTEEEFEELVDTFSEEFRNHEMRFYLFYGQNNAMLTGKQKVTLGVDQFEFMFETDGYLKGSGVMGKRDGRLYLVGKLLKPEAGEKFAIYKQELNNNGMIYKMSVEDFIEENCDNGVYNERKDETVWKAMDAPNTVKYYLVNAGGDIVKNKTKAKNIDGYEITVKESKIQSITVEE